jgi:hypothetical protein
VIDEDVRGLEVAVDNAMGGQISYPQCDPDDDLARVGRRPLEVERERSGTDPLGGGSAASVVRRRTAKGGGCRGG